MKTSSEQLQKHKEYYQKHREERIAYATKWNKEHPKKRKKIMLRDNKKRKDLKRVWHEKKWFSYIGLLNDSSKCYICASHKSLIIHHIDGNNGRNGKPFNNKKSNFVILCRRCHPKVHGRWGLKEVVCI